MHRVSVSSRQQSTAIPGRKMGGCVGLQIFGPNRLRHVCSEVWHPLGSSHLAHDDGGTLQRTSAHVCATEATVVGVEDALEFTPELSHGEKAISLMVALGICGSVYMLTKPFTWSPVYTCGMAVLCGCVLFITYAYQIERKYRVLKRPATELGGMNSKWMAVDAVKLHVTVEGLPDKSKACIRHAFHCLHGFGSHTFSYSMIQKKLAEDLGALVSAHDFCGFGLSQRPRDGKYYSMRFHGEAGLDIIEQLLAEQVNGDATAMPAVKKILVGHSMGASAVAEALIHDEDERIAGVVLIAPAIVCGWTTPATKKQSQSRKDGIINDFLLFIDSMFETEDSLKSSSSSVGTKGSKQAGKMVGDFLRVFMSLLRALLAEFINVIFRVARPILQVAIHPLVFPRQFWSSGLSQAVRKLKIQASMDWKRYVDGYRMPVLVENWEEGLMRFVSARITARNGLLHELRRVLHPENTMLQAERLRDACNKRNVPVLIVHGSDDGLVPVGNSHRLVECLPHASLVTLDCGHCPHEEMPQEFIKVVEQFVRSKL